MMLLAAILVLWALSAAAAIVLCVAAKRGDEQRSIPAVQRADRHAPARLSSGVQARLSA
jgi:hypothetical protein